jgi:hypothetical protein
MMLYAIPADYIEQCNQGILCLFDSGGKCKERGKTEKGFTHTIEEKY